jgi:hypothetical protein
VELREVRWRWGKKRLKMDKKYKKRAGRGCKIVKILRIVLLY